MSLSLEHTRSLEALHLMFLNARLRKRKTLPIHPEEFQRFEDAIKAALPPFDFAAHGFKDGSKSGETG